MQFKKYLNEALSDKDIALLRKRGRLGKDFTGFTTIRSDGPMATTTDPKKSKKTGKTVEAVGGVKVGDIFYNSWGYDQTNIDWYQVVGITKTGKSVKIRPIAAKVKETGFMSGDSRPVKNKFTGKAITKKIGLSRGEPYLGMAHGWTAKWDGKPMRASWYA